MRHRIFHETRRKLFNDSFQLYEILEYIIYNIMWLKNLEFALIVLYVELMLDLDKRRLCMYRNRREDSEKTTPNKLFKF